MALTGDEIDACREAFDAFDAGRTGSIGVWDVQQVLEASGSVGVGCVGRAGGSRGTDGRGSHPWCVAAGSAGACAREMGRQRRAAHSLRHHRSAATAARTPAHPQAMGRKPTNEELFAMVSEVDAGMSGHIGEASLPRAPVVRAGVVCPLVAAPAIRRRPDATHPACTHAGFGDFLRLIEKQRAAAARAAEDDSDLGAWDRDAVAVVTTRSRPQCAR